MNDPIVDEVRRIRDAHAARFNYDLDAIYQDLKEQEKRSGREIVSYAQDPAETKPSERKPPRRKAGASRKKAKRRSRST